MLLQVLDEGKLTDSIGRTVDFRNTVIIMTSNVGAELLRKQSTLGFTPGDADTSYEGMKTKLLDSLKKAFKPEFLNRVDDIVVFRNLSRPELLQIIDLELHTMLKRMEDRGVKVALDTPAKEHILEKGYNPTYGARPIRRALEHDVEDPLSEQILQEKIKDGDTVLVTLRDGALQFDVTSRPAPPPAAPVQPAVSNN
jgi:ATP-dependent Clp protease ATP-binding subunit ClpC